MTSAIDPKFRALFDDVQTFRQAMVRKHCASEEGAVMLASQFLFEAMLIYRQLGGAKHAAAQLYAAADREAAP